MTDPTQMNVPVRQFMSNWISTSCQPHRSPPDEVRIEDHQTHSSMLPSSQRSLMLYKAAGSRAEGESVIWLINWFFEPSRDHKGLY